MLALAARLEASRALAARLETFHAFALGL